jgi:hypothetical protein
MGLFRGEGVADENLVPTVPQWMSLIFEHRKISTERLRQLVHLFEPRIRSWTSTLPPLCPNRLIPSARLLSFVAPRARARHGVLVVVLL